MLPDLFLSLCLLAADPVQPPAHTVPSQRTEQPVGDGHIVAITPKEIKGAVGELISIKAESGAELVTWKATAGLRILNDDPPDPSRKSILVHAATGGTFAICCSIPFEKGTRSAIALVQIGPAPEPVPPKPDPVPPVPGPLVDSVFMVIIEETADAVAARGQMFRDPAIRALIDAGKLKWRTADKDVTNREGKPPGDLAPYLNKAKGKALPQLYLVGPDGKLLYEGDMPAAADVAALVNKYLKK